MKGYDCGSRARSIKGSVWLFEINQVEQVASSGLLAIVGVTRV